MLLAPALLSLLVAPCSSVAAAEKLKAKVPGQEVEISVEIPDFKPEEGMNIPGRTLFAGKMKNDAVVSVLWEANFPYVSTEECPKPYAKEKGFKTYTIDGKACIQFRTEMREVICQSQFYTYLATPDYLYTIHVSRTYPLKGSGGAREVNRSEVESIVKSLAVMGDADRSTFKYPPEAYVFRDEAAKLSSGQLDWVSKQCGAHPDDWAPQFYLGQLADNMRQDEPAQRGYARTSEILAKRADRSPKETRVLVVSLDSQTAYFAQKKKYDQARPFCQTIVEVVKPDDPEEIRLFREQALFNLACCLAMTSKSDEAIKVLRQAIEARPEFKKRAAEETLLASLRTKPEFKRLVDSPSR